MQTRCLAVLVTLFALLTAATPATAAPYQITRTTQTKDGNILRTDFLVQAGAHPLDRFRMTRVAKDIQRNQLQGAILLLPPLGLSFAGFYEQRDPNGALGTSIAEFFALRNFDVYGYSPRFEGIPSGTCEAGILDCSVMATWDLQSMLDDIAFVRSQIELLNPGVEVVTGGASLGGILAVAVANEAPEDYAGIIPWEGMLFSNHPEVRALNQGYCTALEAQLAAGAVFDGVGTSVFKQVVKQSELVPYGSNLIPLFPPTLTAHQLMVTLLSQSSPGPASMPVPNYIQMNGSVAQDRLFYADERRVYDNVESFVNYVPNALVRDISCSLAGTETDYTSNLGNYEGAVLMIGGGRGFGPYMGDQLAQFGSTDKVIRLEPNFGHIDHFMSRWHRAYVERPIYQWARRIFRQP